MIVRTECLPASFDALTVWPFIFVRPASAADSGLMVHEGVHYAEQRRAWVLPWLLRYGLSKRFRLAAEVRGYRAQIAAGGLALDRAAHLLTLYGAGVSEAQARALLTA